MNMIELHKRPKVRMMAHWVFEEAGACCNYCGIHEQYWGMPHQMIGSLMSRMCGGQRDLTYFARLLHLLCIP